MGICSRNPFRLTWTRSQQAPWTFVNVQGPFHWLFNPALLAWGQDTIALSPMFEGSGCMSCPRNVSIFQKLPTLSVHIFFIVRPPPNARGLTRRPQKFGHSLGRAFPTVSVGLWIIVDTESLYRLQIWCCMRLRHTATAFATTSRPHERSMSSHY